MSEQRFRYKAVAFETELIISMEHRKQCLQRVLRHIMRICRSINSSSVVYFNSPVSFSALTTACPLMPVDDVTNIFI